MLHVYMNFGLKLKDKTKKYAAIRFLLKTMQRMLECAKKISNETPFFKFYSFGKKFIIQLIN